MANQILSKPTNDKQRIAELAGIGGLTLCWSFRHTFTPGQAVLLQNLVVWYFYLEREEKLMDDGFFWRSTKSMIYETGLNIRTQQRYLTFFRKHGIIETKLTEDIPYLCFKLNFVKISEYIDAKQVANTKSDGGDNLSQGGRQSVTRGGDNLSPHLIESNRLKNQNAPAHGRTRARARGANKLTDPIPKNYHANLLPDETSSIPIKQIKADFEDESSKLASIVKFTRNMAIPPKTVIKWAGILANFSFESELSKARINQALTWYADHADEKFVPKINTATQFCDKFAALEDAMSRSNLDSGRSVPVKPGKVAIEAGEKLNLDPAEIEPHLPSLQQWVQQVTAWLEARLDPDYHEVIHHDPFDIYYHNGWTSTLPSFVRGYVYWLDQQDSKYVRPSAFNPGSKMFAKYLTSIEEGFSGVNFDKIS